MNPEDQRPRRHAVTVGVEIEVELERTVAGVVGEFDMRPHDAAARIGGFEHGERLGAVRSEEHTSELQSLMSISYAVFCLTKNNTYLDERIKEEKQSNYSK